MKKKTYDIIYSIGYDCSCALYIKETGLRLTSGPFDWLTHASFEERFAALLNEFDDFFNIKDFKKIEKTDHIHDHYENIRTGFYFYHDFAAGLPIEKTLYDVQQKYSRRIKRFYKNIIENQKVLLIFLSQYTDTPNDKIEKLCTEFCKKINKNIDFLIIEHKSQVDSIQKISIKPNILKYNANIVSFDNENKPSLFGNRKVCEEIFKQYQLPFKHRIVKKISRLLARIILPFAFSKKVKKKIKARLRR
ncbi:MAG: hypothetical protein E7013_00130 [Alphaproteobacteria bacterium]|nr:hypothetical protein [Alphaproteobacteria bacterium]